MFQSTRTPTQLVCATVHLVAEMVYLSRAGVALAALMCMASVHADAPGPPNTSTDCRIFSENGASETKYYLSSDVDDVGICIQGAYCDARSFAQL